MSFPSGSSQRGNESDLVGSVRSQLVAHPQDSDYLPVTHDRDSQRAYDRRMTGGQSLTVRQGGVIVVDDHPALADTICPDACIVHRIMPFDTVNPAHIL